MPGRRKAFLSRSEPDSNGFLGALDGRLASRATGRAAANPFCGRVVPPAITGPSALADRDGRCQRGHASHGGGHSARLRASIEDGSALPLGHVRAHDACGSGGAPVAPPSTAGSPAAPASASPGMAAGSPTAETTSCDRGRWREAPLSMLRTVSVPPVPVVTVIRAARHPTADTTGLSSRYRARCPGTRSGTPGT